jgi:drug/metabolite transporter (DMT)-like permease
MQDTSHGSAKRGIGFILLAMLIFSILNAIVKDIVTEFDPIQLVFFRCLFASLPVGALVIARNGWMLPSLSDWKYHLIRAILLAGGLSFLFLGIGMLPLSDSMALYFSSTLFLVILSYPILREKVSLCKPLRCLLDFWVW